MATTIEPAWLTFRRAKELMREFYGLRNDKFREGPAEGSSKSRNEFVNDENRFNQIKNDFELQSCPQDYREELIAMFDRTVRGWRDLTTQVEKDEDTLNNLRRHIDDWQWSEEPEPALEEQLTKYDAMTRVPPADRSASEQKKVFERTYQLILGKFDDMTQQLRDRLSDD